MTPAAFYSLPIFIALGTLALIYLAVAYGPDDPRAKFCFVATTYMIFVLVAAFATLWIAPDLVEATAPFNGFSQILNAIL